MTVIPTGATGATGPTGAQGPKGDTGTAPPLSALYAVNTGDQTPSSGGSALTFATNALQAGSDIAHTASAAEVTLNTAGTYQLFYSTDGTDANSSATPVSCELRLDGTQIEGTKASGQVVATTNLVHLASGAIITATAGQVVTLWGDSDNETFSNTSLWVVKLA